MIDFAFKLRREAPTANHRYHGRPCHVFRYPTVPSPESIIALHRRLPAILMLCLYSAMAVACQPASTSLGQAPDVTVHTLDGRSLALADLGRPTLVNFWSTSCVICLKDMPALARLHEKYAPQGLDVLAVALATDPPNAVLEFAQAQNLPFAVALDPAGAAVDGFERVVGTPTSFLLDADGAILERHVGAINVAETEARFDALLMR